MSCDGDVADFDRSCSDRRLLLAAAAASEPAAAAAALGFLPLTCAVRNEKTTLSHAVPQFHKYHLGKRGKTR